MRPHHVQTPILTAVRRHCIVISMSGENNPLQASEIVLRTNGNSESPFKNVSSVQHVRTAYSAGVASVSVGVASLSVGVLLYSARVVLLRLNMW